MERDWEARLDAWREELELLARAEGTAWVSLTEAESAAGVSRSALRAWYRTGEIASRLVDGPHGPQRLVPLDAVLTRAGRSARIRARTERDAVLTAQVALLRDRVDRLEMRLAALEDRG